MGIYDTRTTEPATVQKNSKPTLLIVDDESGPRESLRIVFKDLYQCATATCGREGIEYARHHPVDAAILDIKMPDISGVDVLRELKEIDPNIECVMLTGYETIETARAAVRYGAADYLNKPFDVFFVRELMQKCLARRKRKVQMEQTLASLQKMNEELSRGLAESNRAVAASILSAGVIHEINNPLAIIAGYAHLLERDLTQLGDVDQTAAQHLQQRLTTIQGEIERCKQISQRFLNFSRNTRGEYEVLEIAKLLDDAVALLKAHPAKKGAEISCELASPLLKVKAYPTELLQVFINLGVNALQAMNGQGNLGFIVKLENARDGGVAFRPETFNPETQHVKVSVVDTGPGISEENLKKIFEPYFTTKAQGTGLGLAIVCELVAQCSGMLEVESVLGQGTTFSVYLPLA
jgi:two-component system sensor histidine kinase/response regulator